MQFYITIGALILCVVCLLDLPFTRRINQTLYGFFLMNGKLRLPGFLASILSANLSIGNFLVFIAAWGYTFGWGGLFWFVINLVLNVVAYLIFMPAFRGYIEDSNNSGTIHEFLSVTFGGVGAYSRRIRLIASAATILGLLFAIVFELHLATDILARLAGIDSVVVFVLLTGFICIYSAAGGFHTLIFTDVLQSIAMIVGTLAIIPILVSLSGVSSAVTLKAAYPVNAHAFNIGWPSILGICVIGSGWFLVAMDQWQRTCATRDSKRTKGGMLWYLVSITGFAVIYALVGMYDKAALLPSLSQEALAQHSKGANPLTDFFLISGVTSAPGWLFVLVAMALLAAAMSTANTFLIVSGHSLVSDLIVAQKRGGSIVGLSTDQDRVFVGIARASIIGMGIFVILAWLLLTKAGLLSDPLSFFFIAYSICLVGTAGFFKASSLAIPAATSSFSLYLDICLGCGRGRRRILGSSSEERRSNSRYRRWRLARPYACHYMDCRHDRLDLCEGDVSELNRICLRSLPITFSLSFSRYLRWVFLPSVSFLTSGWNAKSND